jgi:hypothetical protein
MIDPINPAMSQQAPTESTPTPAPKPAPFAVGDRVTLSSARDTDHDRDCN